MGKKILFFEIVLDVAYKQFWLLIENYVKC